MINNLYIKATPTTAAVTWGSITGTLSDQTDLQTALNAKQDTLTSGTNIKTLEGQSLLGSGNIDLTKSDVGLANVDNTSDLNKPISTATQTALNAKENTITAGTTAQYYRGDKTFQTLNKTAVGLANVDNTSDLNKPISTATQTALNAKQDTLVSGTNIKTINGSSVLGSGDLVVGGGGGIGGLQAFFPVSGNVLPSVPYGGLFAPALIANRILIYPFVPAQNFTTSALRINVGSAVAGANARILIYNNVAGTYRPNTKILESTNLDCSTIGEKSFLYSATFVKGEVYWISVYSNSNPSITHAQASNLFILRQEQGTAMQHIEASYTFGTAPATFPSVVGYNNRNCPNVGFVIA